jgi:hypothetical protein
LLQPATSIPAGFPNLQQPVPCHRRSRRHHLQPAPFSRRCRQSSTRATCTAHPWLIPLWSNYEKKRRNRIQMRKPHGLATRERARMSWQVNSGRGNHGQHGLEKSTGFLMINQAQF